MSEQKTVTLDSLIQEKIDGDTEFQDSLKDLSEEDKESSIKVKRAEILEAEAPKFFEESKKNKELADNYKVRAEKAEGNKGEKKEVTTDDNALTTKDAMVLMRNNVHDEDIDEVVEFARFKKISVADALKSSVMKATLAERTETRKTSAATTTRQTRTTTKVDATKIIGDIKTKGEEAVPGKGSTEAEEVFWARRGGRRESK